MIYPLTNLAIDHIKEIQQRTKCFKKTWQRLKEYLDKLSAPLSEGEPYHARYLFLSPFGLLDALWKKDFKMRRVIRHGSIAHDNSQYVQTR